MTKRLHARPISSVHAYTRVQEPWRMEETREQLENGGKRGGVDWRLYHYISGGGMKAFGRSVEQERRMRRQTRFLVVCGVLAVLWLVGWMV